mmetsp:Transcript_7142/g.14933  ORF Transcript_7142/g.14933 Transcript_7142/m.14933 type:complete len:218 (+) Transcript_7142:2132-2785(+)
MIDGCVLSAWLRTMDEALVPGLFFFAAATPWFCFVASFALFFRPLDLRNAIDFSDNADSISAIPSMISASDIPSNIASALFPLPALVLSLVSSAPDVVATLPIGPRKTKSFPAAILGCAAAGLLLLRAKVPIGTSSDGKPPAVPPTKDELPPAFCCCIILRCRNLDGFFPPACCCWWWEVLMDRRCAGLSCIDCDLITGFILPAADLLSLGYCCCCR